MASQNRVPSSSKRLHLFKLVGISPAILTRRVSEEASYFQSVPRSGVGLEKNTSLAAKISCLERLQRASQSHRIPNSPDVCLVDAVSGASHVYRPTDAQLIDGQKRIPLTAAERHDCDS